MNFILPVVSLLFLQYSHKMCNQFHELKENLRKKSQLNVFYHNSSFGKPIENKKDLNF